MYLEKGMGGVKMCICILLRFQRVELKIKVDSAFIAALQNVIHRRSAFFWSVHVYYIYIFIYIDVFMVILVTDTFDNHNLNTLCTSSATWAREL